MHRWWLILWLQWLFPDDTLTHTREPSVMNKLLIRLSFFPDFELRVVMFCFCFSTIFAFTYHISDNTLLSQQILNLFFILFQNPQLLFLTFPYSIFNLLFFSGISERSYQMRKSCTFSHLFLRYCSFNIVSVLLTIFEIISWMGLWVFLEWSFKGEMNDVGGTFWCHAIDELWIMKYGDIHITNI